MSGKPTESVLRRLHGAAAGILAVKVVGTGLAFLAQLVLARRLGAEGLGAYALALAMLNALLVFSRMGFDISSLRIASLLHDDDDRAGLHGFLRVGLRLPAAAAALLAAGVLAVVGLGFDGGPVRSSLLVAAGALVPWTVVLVDQGQLRALGRRVAAFVPGEVVRPGLLLAGILVAGPALAGAADAPRAVGIHVGALLAAVVVSRALLHRTVPGTVRATEPAYRVPAWVRTSVGLGVVTGLTALLGQVDTLIVGSVLPTGDVGLFSVSRRLAALLGFGLLAVNAAVAPGFARLYRAGRTGELADLTRRSALLATLATLPPVLLFLVAGRWVLGWFGPEFPPAYPLLLVFSVGQLVNAACGPVALLLSLTGHARETAAVLAFGLVTLGAGCLLGASRFGVVGAAAVSATVMAGWNLAMVVVARSRLGIRVGLV